MKPERDWFVRCEAIYEPLGDNAAPERCGFPSLDSGQWYMHPDEHESATYAWGHREVVAAKERKRAEGEIS